MEEKYPCVPFSTPRLPLCETSAGEQWNGTKQNRMECVHFIFDSSTLIKPVKRERSKGIYEDLPSHSLTHMLSLYPSVHAFRFLIHIHCLLHHRIVSVMMHDNKQNDE